MFPDAFLTRNWTEEDWRDYHIQVYMLVGLSAITMFITDKEFRECAIEAAKIKLMERFL